MKKLSAKCAHLYTPCSKPVAACADLSTPCSKPVAARADLSTPCSKAINEWRKPIFETLPIVSKNIAHHFGKHCPSFQKTLPVIFPAVAHRFEKTWATKTQKKGRHRKTALPLLMYSLGNANQSHSYYFKPRFFNSGSVPGSLPRKFLYITIASSIPPGVKTY